MSNVSDSLIKSLKSDLTSEESVIVEDMTVGQLADRLKCPVSNLIVFLLQNGIFASKNQIIKKDEVEKILKLLEVSIAAPTVESEETLERFIGAKTSGGTEYRLPVVTVVGHVDHGKTSLLDYIRKTKVAAREKGGITQHITAYEVSTKHGGLVFLDTPGHEAFSLMRERGVLVADLVVLIVALDDGIKPQTVECIKKIKEFGATVVVALNKVDKVKPDRLDIVKRQLADYDMLPDEWGGDVAFVPVSAKTGQGVEELLEVLRLQADILDLKTTLTGPAQGFIIESMVERGKGPVATALLHKGSLSVGDYFICGQTEGKVTSLENCFGKALKSVGPSVPVKIAGFSSLPSAGDLFELATLADVKKHKNKSKSPIFKKQIVSSEVDAEGISVILKAATQLSLEALLLSLDKLNEKHNGKIKIIDAGIGDINESNLELAVTTNAVVYGLGVKVHKAAVARINKTVDIKTYDIIYQLLDNIEEYLEKNKIQKVVEKELGIARVKAIFKIKSIGIVAGAAVESGVLQQAAKIRVYRDGKVVGSGVIKTLQRERSNVATVSENNDCAFAVDNFTSWKIGDEVHCFIEIKS